jgi:NitT/TauT family transport system ATP-binding protein
VSTRTATAVESAGVGTAVHVGTSHIALERVAKDFETSSGSLQAVADVSLAVAPGEFVSLLGPSGCGKSTLLRIMAGLTPPTGGSIRIAGGRPVDAQREKRVGMVFQQPALMPWRTVLANVALPLEVNRRGANATRRQSEIAELLSLVGLAEFGRAYPYQLSGGMQQRVAIARALVFNPDILLMDEPFGALDEITRDQMRYELLRIWSAARKTVVFVTHSIAEAIILSDRIAVMSARPGTLREVLEVRLPRPRGEQLESSPEFLRMAEHLKALLRPTGASLPGG